MSTRSDQRTIIVLPGGGYRVHAAHEAEPVAEWMQTLGWSTRVLRYPIPSRHPAPLEAVRATVRDERRNGASSVGVIGFSAGGHLAGHALLAPDSTDEERPDFGILGYPVVSMLTPDRSGSERQLLGADASDELRAAVSLDRLVTPETRPLFIWHTAGDPSVPVEEHSYRLGAALASARVSHELHVFPGDVHGIGLASGTAAEPWRQLCAAWLHRLSRSLS